METVRLRPEVTVRDLGAEISIAFAHWQVHLPMDATTADDGLRELLAGAPADVSKASGTSRGIIQLLAAQGCFLPHLPDALTARQALKLFQPIRSQLYAQYYRHPEWQRIRNGEASKGELAAWMVHNYHVSRSAGVIAARAGSFSVDGETRAFFQQDSLEEYWHCESFYFVKQAAIELNASDVKRYVALPASTGFEEHALRAAEEDPLAHLLIAYFQESSIMFRQDAERFYSDVEKQYGIGGAFGGWRRHMTLDLDHDHAGELESRFDDTTPLSAEAVRSSIQKAHYAQYFLLKALDQIADFKGTSDGVTERQPEHLVLSPVPKIRLDRASADFLLHSLRDATFRSLAFARSHDQIIATGRLASKVDKALADINERKEAGPWLVACRNFLVERSIDAGVYLPLACWLIGQLAVAHPQYSELLSSLEGIVPSGTAPNAVELFRLVELLQLISSDEAFVPLSMSLNA